MGEAAEINQCRKRSREVVGTGALSTCRHAALGNWEVSYTALWVYRRVLSFCSANETFFFFFPSWKTCVAWPSSFGIIYIIFLIFLMALLSHLET